MGKSTRREFLSNLVGYAVATTVATWGLTKAVTNFVPIGNPDEVFFEVCKTFGIDYRNPEVAPYMQPPVVKFGNGGCKDSWGCWNVDENTAYVATGGLSVVSHELGHSVFTKSRMYLEEGKAVAILERQYRNPDLDLDGIKNSLDDEERESLQEDFTKLDRKSRSRILARKIVDRGVYYKKSYDGYPDSKMFGGAIGASDTIGEFVAFAAQELISGEDAGPEILAGLSERHRDAIHLFWYVVDEYGRGALLPLSGEIVRTTNPKINFGERGLDYWKNRIRMLAQELDIKPRL